MWSGTMSDSTRLYVTMVIMSIAALIAIAGNLLIVILFLKIKKLARLTPHIFLTNLALCDLILGLKLPLFFLVTLGHRNSWIFKDPTACLVGGVADSFAIRIVVAGMIAVAVDRYLAVLHAVRYPIIMPEKRAFIVVYLMWIYCLFWSLLPVVVGALDGNTTSSVYTFSDSHNMCVFKLPDTQHHHSYLYKAFIATDLLLNFVTPVTVMTVCYLRIALKVMEPKHVGNTLRRIIRNASLSIQRRSSRARTSSGVGVIANSAAPKDSGIGIMVEGCESIDDNSDDFIELPAITKPQNTTSSVSPVSYLSSSKLSSEPASNPSNTPETLLHAMPPSKSCFQSPTSAHKPSPTRAADPRHNAYTSRYRISNADTANFMPKSASLSLAQTTNVGHTRVSLVPSPTRIGSKSNADQPSKRSKSIGVLTSNVMAQLRRISHASTAFSKMSKYQQKIARTTVIVYLSFFCCFIPYICSQIVILVLPRDHKNLAPSLRVFVFVSVCMVYFNACINVIIYGTMHRNIKNTLRGIFSAH